MQGGLRLIPELKDKRVSSFSLLRAESRFVFYGSSLPYKVRLEGSTRRWVSGLESRATYCTWGFDSSTFLQEGELAVGRGPAATRRVDNTMKFDSSALRNLGASYSGHYTGLASQEQRFDSASLHLYPRLERAAWVGD